MATTEEAPNPKRPKRLTGVGTIDPPASVLTFAGKADPLMSEADWVKAGRPTHVIRYTVQATHGGERFAWATTFVPACLPLRVVLTCPDKCKNIETLVSLVGRVTVAPVHYEQAWDRDDGLRRLDPAGGYIPDHHWWDHDGSADSHQRYASAIGGDLSREPLYPVDRPANEKPKRKKGTRAKPPGSATEPTTVEIARLEDDGGIVADDTPAPTPAENDPCPTTTEPTTDPSTSSPAPSPGELSTSE